MLENDVVGYKVNVTVRPPPGTTMTTEDADVVLTSAAGLFPQRLRTPEPLHRRQGAPMGTLPAALRKPRPLVP
jgi:hypothetical protein